MSLLAKLMQEEDPPIAAHTFDAIMNRRLLDDYAGPRARQELEAHLTENNGGVGYTLTTVEADSFADYKTFHDGLANAAAKRDHRQKIPHLLILLQNGHITRATYRAEVGITSEV